LKHWYLVRESRRPRAAGLKVKLAASVGGETAIATEPTQPGNPLPLRRRRPRLFGEWLCSSDMVSACALGARDRWAACVAADD
jgi:hypothetical protein